MQSQEILKDPMAAASKLELSLSEQRMQALTQLQASRLHCREEIAKLQEQQGIQSRLVGEAKKRGDDASDLIGEMRAISTAVKSSKVELKRLEEEVQAYFLPEDGSTTGANEARDASSSSGSRYQSDAPNAASEYSICELNEDTANWDAFVQANPAASIYHLARWRALIIDCFGHETHYLQAIDSNNAVVGVLPLVRLKSRLFGDYLVSVPFFNYGGALAVTAKIETALMQRAEHLAQELGVSHIEFRDTIEREPWPKRTDKVAMILQLPKTVEQLEKQIGTKLRAQIKRAQRERPTVLHGGAELLDDFYAVFARNMRDLGTPVYAKHFFAAIMQVFPAASHLIVIRHKDKPVSAAFLLGFQQKMEIPWASTLREVNKLSINMLLYREVLQYAIEQKACHFDFGRSTRGAGTYKFKKQWGAEELPLHWHYWLRDGGELPRLNPDNPKYRLAINVWRRLPVGLTKLIGPSLVKNLP